ncbi:XRE family transcriptional regulator (plasmid) [Bacillus carboniphilus]|uniref:XRE family transcriptional regulator n=1 Tax=Bacillus carboniphilus TaxID=86663 RepID=A0ABY9JYN3_9BACI|nr:XRE family transcriptional regulator [Bacillus carboniphilus]WLR44497.1 XRE family transcriptional regulator [Bacillus carboniphilus]
MFFKRRSPLQKFLDVHGIPKKYLIQKSGLSKNTIGDLTAVEPKHTPTAKTIKKIMRVIKEIDPKAKADDFFDL